jgi:hypothetical protein
MLFRSRLSGKKSRTNRFLVHKSSFFFNKLPWFQLEWKLDRFFFTHSRQLICLHLGTRWEHANGSFFVFFFSLPGYVWKVHVKIINFKRTWVRSDLKGARPKV